MGAFRMQIADGASGTDDSLCCELRVCVCAPVSALVSAALAAARPPAA